MFVIPPSRKSSNENRFTFEHDGGTHTVALLQFAPVATAEAFEQGHNVAGILAACDSDETRAVVRSLDGEQFGALMHAWEVASGVTPGESAASTDS